jgi:hypothetical protein
MKPISKKTIIVFAFLSLSIGLKAQQTDAKKSTTSADSLLNAIDGNPKSGPVVIFKSSRLVLSQTTETVKKGNLNFQIIHRFGDLAGKNGGPQTAFGLDAVNDVYFGFEYGITDNLNVDFGRSTVGQLLQVELKYALLHQTSDGQVPVALTILGEAGVRPYGQFQTFDSRVSHLAQLIIARKFSSEFSFQVSPTFVSDNTAYPLAPGNEQQFFAVQGAARLKVTRHMGIILDYAHPFSSYRQNNATFQDPIGTGIEIETGGHVFTLNITNTNSISEINYLSNSQQRFSKGQYRIGFTISRMFDLNKHKEKE